MSVFYYSRNISETLHGELFPCWRCRGNCNNELRLYILPNSQDVNIQVKCLHNVNFNYLLNPIHHMNFIINVNQLMHSFHWQNDNEKQ
jgi:hypothetical protein